MSWTEQVEILIFFDIRAMQGSDKDFDTEINSSNRHLNNNCVAAEGAVAQLKLHHVSVT